MKIVDLGRAIEHENHSDPPVQMARFEYWDHKMGGPSMLETFTAATLDDLPKGLGWASEGVMLTTHTGTHMDAPYHYHPTSNNGEPAKTIDQIPVEWFYSDGVMFDFSDRPDGTKIMAKDFQEALDKMNYKLKPLDIVFVRSGSDPYYGADEYRLRGCGMGYDATIWLLRQGIRIVGTDAWSWDVPLPLVAKEFEKTHDKSIIWEGHFTGIEQEYCHIEKLQNLDKLPTHGFKVVAVPINIKNGSAGWVRPIAILDD